MTMVQEEHAQKCINSSSGDGGGCVCRGRSLKKLKQIKVPQRGLGVAQLEKIRLEEQHKRENNAFDHEGSERGRSGLINSSKSHWPKLWGGEYNLEGGESPRQDKFGIPFWPNINIPIELHSSVLHLPTALEISQQYQQPLSPSTVNILSKISSSMSPSRNFQIEPPTNQIYCDNDYTPKEVKMVGVKRPYPFSPEYPPVPSFNFKFPLGYVSSTSWANNEPISCDNGSVANVLESHNLPISESTSSSQFESNSRSLNRKHGGLNGDFLSLSPPAAPSSLINHRCQDSSRNQLPHNPETSNQSGDEKKMKRSRMQHGWGQPHNFNFFPPAMLQSDLEESSKRSYKSESNEGVVDLNLKL